MKHVIRLWAYDTKEAHRIKEGDVISVREYHGDPAELDNGTKGDKCSISFVVDGLTPDEIRMMCEAEYEGGLSAEEVDVKYEAEYQDHLESCDKFIELQYDKFGRPVLDDLGIQATKDVYTPIETSLPVPKMTPTVKKRRYNIPLDTIKSGWCPDLDVVKVRDVKASYSPTIAEVDATEKVAFCVDKVSDTFKYAAVKVI